eukprot:CAMPEP_0183302780 /NCGR_PEP_ID=MMETSP0160_2-20130417/8443_1 /TAXON_ID=2839 ORGANISM="Odontella Sinensis, Strain Grunow 1884" /NCGR_SAMPLE_ID=MMETSP0160_2 /ASSEMBLY_ACC=CAM_ASM_000250 /LENGTH=321 /DNA_ID=CAMNT_0025465593 /DNA_START=176 /DNA_END=1142 /DNA_ORIENTATION=-
MAPSLCGQVVSSKRSLLAVAWSVATVLAFSSFVAAGLFSARIERRYAYLARLYGGNDDDEYQKWYEEDCDDKDEKEKEGDGGGGEGDGGGDRARRLARELEGSGDGKDDACHRSGDSSDEDFPYSYYPTLASQSSTAVTFAALNAGGLAVTLSLYGSLSIVGFSSVKGAYIAPCLGTTRSPAAARTHLGVFLGMLVLFSNVCLVCAVVLGEFRVTDYLDEEDHEELDPYKIESIARILCALCTTLAVVYGLYAVLLFALKDDIIPDDGTGSGVRGGGSTLLGGAGGVPDDDGVRPAAHIPVDAWEWGGNEGPRRILDVEAH